MDNGIFYPAESPYVISVGAITSKGKRVTYSNYGSNLDFVAPGQSVNVANYKSNNSFLTVSGTSLACPYVSSAAALVRAEKGKISYSQVKSELISICIDYGTTGKDNYYGYGMPKFVAKKSMSGYTVKLGYTSTTYTGSAKTPSVSISGLTKGTDYTVSYSNNVNAGTATVTVNGIGNYSGSRTANFTINPKPITPTLVLSQTTLYYNNKEIRPTVTVKYGNTVMPESEYTLTTPAQSKDTGTYQIKVTMKHNYSGTATASYRIVKHKSYIVVTKNGRFWKIIEKKW